jgi:hypothetical protein
MGRAISDLAQQLRDLHRHITKLQAEFIHTVAEFDATHDYELDDHRSAASWLRTELRLHARDAAQLVGMARQVRQLPGTDAAFTAGDISQQHVALLARAARQVGADAVRAVEQELLAVAASSGPERLRVATQHLRYCADPDGAQRDAVKQYERRDLSLAPTLDGMVSIQGWLDPASGVTVIAAVNALCPPPRDTDPRSAGQKRADALTELCRRSLDSGDLPESGGEKPEVVVTVPYQTLLGELGAGPARINWAGPITAGDARRFACDCGIIPAVLDAAGEVLDIGRKTRIWPTAIARAIGLRDKTCRHLDCDAPAEYCDLHHVRHWADGGKTSYDKRILR